MIINFAEQSDKRVQIHQGLFSGEDDFENGSESAKGSNSPKIYDLRTPQKKSRITETMLDTTSDKSFWDKPFTDKHARKIVDAKPIKSTMS